MKPLKWGLETIAGTASHATKFRDGDRGWVRCRVYEKGNWEITFQDKVHKGRGGIKGAEAWLHALCDSSQNPKPAKSLTGRRQYALAVFGEMAWHVWCYALLEPSTFLLSAVAMRIVLDGGVWQFWAARKILIPTARVLLRR